MATNLPAWPGTISIAAGGTAITGTGAALTTGAQGALIIVNGLVGQLAADPTDDNHATLLEPISATAITNASYVLVPISGAVAQAQRVRTTLETLAALPTVAGQIGAATETALADADEFGAVQSASGNLIKRSWANAKAQLETYFDTIYQAALGFTPVQQGTGVGQLSNAVKLGWDGTGLRATVDTTDLGFISIGALAAQSLAANGYQKLPSGLIVQWGVDTAAGADRTVTLPITYPNAHLAVVVTSWSTSAFVLSMVDQLATASFAVRQRDSGGAATIATGVFFFSIGH